MDNSLQRKWDFLFYTWDDWSIKVHVIVDNGTVWVTQSSMAEIFWSSKQTISYHLQNIYNEWELQQVWTVKEILTVQSEWKREVTRKIEHYNLDVIISVWYRVTSYKATQFRIWATTILRDYSIKWFVLNDDRLKQWNNLFWEDYFEELLDRIREIRGSERRFYQKITDLYATSSDYDNTSKLTKEFFATVQNKLHWAIHHHTSAELIAQRADSTKPNMGLTTWSWAKSNRKIVKTDVSVAKNYLTESELDELNRIVSMYLDYAENMAKKRKVMKMSDWVEKLDSFLEFNEYEILNNLWKIQAKTAKKLAEKEYSKFKVIQDRNYESDFDKVVLEVNKWRIPDTTKKEELSDFNKNLKKWLDYNPKD